MRRLPRLAAGAAVALAVGPAVVLADSPRDQGRAAVTSTSPAHGATPARAQTEVGGPAPASGHQHIDPVSAGLLVVDGITVLTVVVLLLRRPRRPAPGGG